MTPEQRIELIGDVYRNLGHMADDDKLGAIALLTGYTLEELRDLDAPEPSL